MSISYEGRFHGQDAQRFIYLFFSEYRYKVSPRPDTAELLLTRFSLSVENERADAGWDDRTRFARSNSQAARAETGNGHEQDF